MEFAKAVIELAKSNWLGAIIVGGVIVRLLMKLFKK